MSKDRGTKNVKKAPADKTKGKGKVVSAYKSEGKNSLPVIESFISKPSSKTSGSQKSKKD